MNEKENISIKSAPKDVFMHLLNISALYVSISSVLVLFFQYINVYFPDKLERYYYFDAGNPIRFAIASLIIVFPVFIWSTKFLLKDINRNPEKNFLRIRRWLIYFTLFATAIIIIGDLISLLYNFLQGELTIRFSLKVFSVFLVSSVVFLYYFYDLKREPKEKTSLKIKIFTRIVIVAVLAIVVVGFFVSGSPFKQRALRFDRQRIENLQTIQSQIVNFWQQKEKLPDSLSELTDNISGFSAPKDPETGMVYDYEKKSDLSFNLCAKFNYSSDEEYLAGRKPTYYLLGYGEENWEHPVGEYCFLRNIDPELYKLNEPKIFYD
ncbi:hypothetical protein JW698_00835 [Candidatus Wolfebacteria bacterium]|nr:hypothetical protein [Candidatus Wolfebacteria bacterium]